jgi:hypothetical protein
MSKHRQEFCEHHTDNGVIFDQQNAEPFHDRSSSAELLSLSQALLTWRNAAANRSSGNGTGGADPPR